MRLLLSVLTVAHLTSANSQDDNLADKMRADTGPELPTVDNIVQASADNLDLLIKKQLSENIVSVKKHRPLLLALVQRQAEGNLDFQREYVKLAGITHRQYELAVADCQFE